MATDKRWIRNTADLIFRAIGVLAIRGIAEIFTDIKWVLIFAGLAISYLFFCCFCFPLG